MLQIPTQCYDQMIQEAIEKYPAECCGFLLGEKNDEEKIIRKILVCENKAAITEKEFSISPKNYMQAEKNADETGLCLLGVYHSHPDTLAVPSATDLEKALPSFSYVIMSVFTNRFSSARSWQLNEELQFEEEKIITSHHHTNKHITAYGNHHHSYTAS